MHIHECTLDLSAVFKLGVGYHGAAWVDMSGDDGVHSDRTLVHPLDWFVAEVAELVRFLDIDRRIGVAYCRVIDGAHPENYMKWHIDNPDGAVRFHTAIATDDAPVNLLWAPEPAGDFHGVKVTDTDWGMARQPANGHIVAFTTEVHGVRPQHERAGEMTAIFFATLYRTRQEADLHTTNNTQTDGHAALPVLEPSR